MEEKILCLVALTPICQRTRTLLTSVIGWWLSKRAHRDGLVSPCLGLGTAREITHDT